MTETTLTISLKDVHTRTRLTPSVSRWQKGRYPEGSLPTYSWREYEAKPRLYVSVDGESMASNLIYRRSRPSSLYRQLLPAMYAELGLPAETKAAWSQKAGCSCGCSPGFVLTLPAGSGVDSHFDAWAVVEGGIETQVDLESAGALALANQRAQDVDRDPTLPGRLATEWKAVTVDYTALV